MIPAPEKLSQVWIFYQPMPRFQQESDSRRVRFDGLENGLKSPGCRQISVAYSRTKKEDNPIFSIPYGRCWIALEHKGRLLREPQPIRAIRATLTMESYFKETKWMS
jgi:hypothetical protein